ncbi:MAG: M23 family metallopeptidase [Pseudomonadota bacterium]
MSVKSSMWRLAADAYRTGRVLSRVLSRVVVLAAIPVLFSVSQSPAQSEFSLGVPVVCTLGVDCFIQNYFDGDPGPGIGDYACTAASYDGHTGTDFRVVSMADIARGVSVVASASGTVKATRDGMMDVIMTDEQRADVEGRECGNGVVLDHGNGWETQYCHLRRGSVEVERGDVVAAGDKIGEVGSSGLSEFPHLELSVRKDGENVDPFTGMIADGVCGPAAEAGALWADGVTLPEPQSEDLEAGFTTGPISPDDAVGKTKAFPLPEANGAALVYYAHLANLRAGDVQRIQIIRPNGEVLVAQQAEALPQNQASYVIFAGRRKPDGGWPTGTYRGEYQLIRGDDVVLQRSDRVEVR